LDEYLSDLYIIKSGRLEIYTGEEVLETLYEGDFFGEKRFLYKMPDLFKIRVAVPVEICKISGSELLNIPVVRWKLFETIKKRRKHINYRL